MTGLIKIDGTFIYAITKSPSNGLETYSKIKLSDYNFSDITISGVQAAQWYPIYNTGKLFYVDFYSSSRKGIVNYDGTIITQDATIMANWDSKMKICGISQDGTILYGLGWSSYRYDGTYYNQDVQAKYFNASTFALIKSELLSANGPWYGNSITFYPGIVHNGGKCLSVPFQDPNGDWQMRSYKIGADKYFAGGTTADTNARKSAAIGILVGRTNGGIYYDGNGYVFVGTSWSSYTVTVTAVKSYMNLS
jgi:hypothetical protein